MRKICIFLAVLFLCFSGQAMAEVEIVNSINLELDAHPIDIATSADGSYTFVLVKGGKIIIFDRKGKLKDTLTVDPSIESIDTTPKGDFLMLATSKEKVLQIVQIGFVVDIDISGLPFKGKASAPVVIAVFSDYQ
jgi:hypothetical protein